MSEDTGKDLLLAGLGLLGAAGLGIGLAYVLSARPAPLTRRERPGRTNPAGRGPFTDTGIEYNSPHNARAPERGARVFAAPSSEPPVRSFADLPAEVQAMSRRMRGLEPPLRRSEQPDEGGIEPLGPGVAMALDPQGFARSCYALGGIYSVDEAAGVGRENATCSLEGRTIALTTFRDGSHLLTMEDADRAMRLRGHMLRSPTRGIPGRGMAGNVAEHYQLDAATIELTGQVATPPGRGLLG